MKQIPRAMQYVPKDKHKRHPTSQYAENSKYGDSASFESPCDIVFKVVTESQIEPSDWNEEETEENLLCLCGKQLLRNSDRSSCRHPTQWLYRGP